MINDAYKEALRCLKKDKDKNLYYLTEPHLLYLTAEQSQKYINVTNQKRYNTRIQNETLKLLLDNLAAFCAETKEDISFIDLGPGVPHKTVAIAKHIKAYGGSFYYYPVDINREFLQIARDYLLPYSNEVIPIQADFDVCQKFIPESCYNRKIIIMLGTTFMNFEINYILDLLKNLSRDQAITIINAELISKENDAIEMIAAYNSKDQFSFTFGPLSHLGFKENHVKPKIIFDNSRIEFHFQILDLPSTYDLPLIIGDNVITAVSYRYKEEYLKETISKHFNNSRYIRSLQNNMWLGLLS